MRIDFTISFFDLLILAYLSYVAYKGYQVGAIVKTVSLFVLSIGLLISSVLSFVAYLVFFRTSIVPEIYSALTLLFSFGLSIYFSEHIQHKVNQQLKGLEITKTSRYLGSLLSFAKGFIIVGIFSLIILAFNVTGKFLPSTEQRSFMLNFSSWTLSSTIRTLRPLYCKANYLISYNRFLKCSNWLSEEEYKSAIQYFKSHNMIPKPKNQQTQQPQTQQNQQQQNQQNNQPKTQQQNQVNPNKKYIGTASYNKN